MRDNDGMQGIATQKHTVANAGQGVGDGDGLQGWATKKRTVANAGHGVRDGDGLQGWATIKRTVANAGHRVGDGDGLQGWATKVFATHCISIDFVLNGRKVTSWILRMVKKMKI